MINNWFHKYNGNSGGPAQGEPIPDGETAAASKILRRGIRVRLLIVGILLVLAFLYNQCVVITKPNEFMVIQQFGEITRITNEPGISLKLPFIQKTRSVPKMIQLYDIPISDVITQDKKTMVADSLVLWRVSDPTKFIRTLSGNVASAQLRIGNIAYNSMKNVISRLPQADIISGRDELADKIFANIGTTLDQYGVELIAIETKHLDLPNDNKEAVYTRMISERNNIAASFQAEGEEEARKIRNETDKTVSILLSTANATAAETIAQGEQKYMEILAEAYNDPEKAEFYSFVRALDASKEALKSGDTTLILSSDSPIARIFYNID